MAAKAKRKRKRPSQTSGAKAGAAKPKQQAKAAVAEDDDAFKGIDSAKPAPKTGPDGKPVKRLERRAAQLGEEKEKAPHRLDVRYGVVRPKPIWAPFPLTELATLIGIVLFVIGFLLGSNSGAGLIGAGALILTVTIGEMCLREHMAGFKSHSLLLAFLPVIAIHTFVYFVISDQWIGPVAVFVDLSVFAILFLLLHQKYRVVEREAQAAARAQKKKR